MTKTPEPAWQSLQKDGNIEIRHYEPMIMAQVTTTGKRYDAINDGFRILARYIFGGNTSEQSIAMTAPVTQTAGQKIDMTAPVTQTATSNDNQWLVGFVMPAEYTLATLPKPNDNNIQFVALPARDTAVIQFTGFNSDSNIQNHRDELLAWLDKNGIKHNGRPTYAFYDPPWVLPFFKRNEVIVDVLSP